MFKSEAKLFLSANNNLNYAKTIINECKRLVNEIESQENSDYIKCKNNIINCDIDALANKVETTKESLMKLDQSFASEYMALLQEYLQAASIDTSNMTDEEKMQYSIQMNAYARDYNYSLLYMLEKYEESDMLTPELQAQLEIQRTIVEQYDVQDKMATLTTTSQEYIDLFKTNAEYDKKLINLNPNLTDEEKSSYLKEYENSFNSTLEILELNRDVAKKTDELKNLEQGSEAYYKKENEIRQLQINYYEGKENLTEQEKKQLDFLKDGVELNELYIDKEQNNGFWHPFVEGEYDEAILDKKIEMGIATEDEIAYDKMNGWERAWENTKTFSTSVVFGIGSVTETVVDGVVMLAGEAGSCFGADTQWAEDFVSIHYADDAYTGLVQSDCINSVSAYSAWHTAGNMIGTTVGYVALSYLPGGPIVTGLAGGFSAMGSSSQRALDSGATFHEAFGTGAISFGAGFASGWAVGKLGKLAQTSTSLMQVGGYTLAGMGVSTLEPIVNSVAEYAIYANEMIDENGNKVYDNIWDYYVDGGGLTNTAMAGVSGGISVGSKALKSYKGVQTYKRLTIEDQKLKDVESQKWKDATESYDAINGKGSFDKLDDATKRAKVNEISYTDKQIKEIRTAAANKINGNINNTIDNVVIDYKNGKYNTKYSVGDILGDYKGDQVKYWSDAALTDYYNEFLKNADSNGNVKVYMFQNNSTEPGVRNYKSFGGSLGPKDGGFVMSEEAYKKLLSDSDVFDKSGKVKNSALLGERLGGVDFGGSKNIIAIEQTVNISDIKVPNGSYSAAFPGYWSPGGKTIDTGTGRGLVTEAVVPQGNINNAGSRVIQH